MPTLDSSELNHLFKSVASFAEEALATAIEQARDPDKAVQFIARLEQALEQDRNQFSVAALCAILGEARVEAAIPVLLEEATCEDLPLSQEVAAYALQRMGGRALEATMTFVEGQPNPARRVLGYEILLAGLDADRDLRVRVTDFCLEQTRIESDRDWPEDGWNPEKSVCTTLVRLGDTRVRSMLLRGLTRSKSEVDREVWQNLLDELDCDEVPDWLQPWRLDWPEQCRTWAELAEDELDQDAGYGEEDFQNLATQTLAREFGDSPFARNIERVSTELATVEVGEFLRLGIEYVSTEFDCCDPVDVEELLYDVYPRTIVTVPGAFGLLLRVLEAFVAFLHQTCRSADTAELIALLREARRKLPELDADRSNWGPTKTLVMSGTEAGYDMFTEEGVAAWMREFNLRVSRGSQTRPALNDTSGYWVASPIHRTQPRVGRNDPCMCGSGRKYKKCCGR